MNNPLDWVGEQWDAFSGQDAADESAAAIAAAAARDQAYNFPDVEGVLGSSTNEIDPVTGKVRITTKLSDQQNALLQGLYGDAGTSRQRVEDALYQRSTSRLDPQWQDRENQSQTRLYNMGLREGDAAYDTAKRNEGFERTDAYDNARRGAIAAGGQEQSRLISAIMQAANPGITQPWGTPNSTDSAIAQANLQASVPSGLDAILGIGGLAASAYGAKK